MPSDAQIGYVEFLESGNLPHHPARQAARRQEWHENCGNVRHDTVKEEVGADVLEFMGKPEKVEQLSVTGSVSVDC